MTDTAWRNVSLEGKTALVTGAARGQGAAHARLFAARGARVVLTDVLEAEGKATAGEIGDAARFVRHDVTEPDGWDAAVGVAIADFGGLDILVNNAAICEFRMLEEETLDGFERLVRINLSGTFLGIKAAIEPMKARGGGSIVNISSVAGLTGPARLGSYSASKWGVRGLTKVAAGELGHYGIRVNSIHPGVIDTPMIAGLGVERGEGKYESVPLRRIGVPEDVSELVAFLASDASSFMTGAELTIDGGSMAAAVGRRAGE
jgi:3alpha(or 20beta)-hydroxysteroid dehydrogenase